MSARAPDLNAWAGYRGALAEPQGLSPVWTRDPLDGGPPPAAAAR